MSGQADTCRDDGSRTGSRGGLETRGTHVHTVLELPVARGSLDAIVELFRSLRLFELGAANDGFVAARLLVAEADAGDPVLVVSEWTEAAAVQRWVDDPARERVTGALSPYLVREPVRHTYTTPVEWPP